MTVTGSQKGLMLPPGLGFNAVSEKALAAGKTSKMPRAYWDWQEMLKANASGFFPYTPATNLLYALHEALQMLREEGLENVFRRHERYGEATRAAVQAWGLEVVCEEPLEHSNSLTAVLLPDGHNADQLREDHSREIRHVARNRPRQARRQGVSHRPSRRVQRRDAGRNAERRGNGPRACGRAAQAGRRSGGAHLACVLGSRARNHLGRALEFLRGSAAGSFRTITDRLPARRRRTNGALQLAVRATSRRRLRPPHRRHRRRALVGRDGRRAFSNRCAGSASTGTKVRRWAARMRRTFSPSAISGTCERADKLLADGHAYRCYCSPALLTQKSARTPSGRASAGNTIAPASD